GEGWKAVGYGMHAIDEIANAAGRHGERDRIAVIVARDRSHASAFLQFLRHAFEGRPDDPSDVVGHLLFGRGIQDQTKPALPSEARGSVSLDSYRSLSDLPLRKSGLNA